MVPIRFVSRSLCFPIEIDRKVPKIRHTYSYFISDEGREIKNNQPTTNQITNRE